MKKNKKMLVIIGIVVIILVISSIFIILDNLNIEKKVIVQKVHLNNAWGFYGEATIVCENGYIYHADLTNLGSYSKAKSMNDEEMNIYILRNGKKIKNAIKQEEIKEILRVATQIQNNKLKNIDNAFKFNDAGITTIKVYNKDKKEFMILSKSGDVEKININSNALNIKKLINNIINRININN